MNFSIVNRGIVLLDLAIALAMGAITSPAATANAPRQLVPGAELFRDDTVHRLEIRIPASGIEQLRQEPRKYVRATIREADAVYENVAIHLKGSTGSFRPIDAKPALTVNFGKFASGQRFHGLQKIHLNNSVEDPSYLNERIGSELFRTANVPAPRVGWALVELNGRSLGLYVLKEGFTPDFLRLHFSDTSGNLYEGTGYDVTESLDRDEGDGPDTQEDRKALAAAVLEADLARRWKRLEDVLDLERFMNFMALEVMLGHRDGYCLSRNNYRIYHDPASGKMVFLPHGMDQLFGRADMPWQPQMGSLVAQAILQLPEGRRAYRERFGSLLTNVFDIPTLTRQMERWGATIEAQLSGPDARALARAAADLKERVAHRRRSLLEQLAEPEVRPLPFANGAARPAEWFAVDAPDGGVMDRVPAPDGTASLHIRAGPRTLAAWRNTVLLAKGRYRFEGRARTKNVQPLAFGNNRGAGLRVAGIPQAPYDLTGDQGWTPLRVEFDVTVAERTTQLVCELRAKHGEVWFDLESLRIVRLP